MFVNGAEIYKSKPTDSGINGIPLGLVNVLKDFSVDNMKNLGYLDTSVSFQLIMIVLMSMITWIFINI